MCLGLGSISGGRSMPAPVTDVPLGFGPCFVLDSERRGRIRCSRPTSTAEHPRPLHCRPLPPFLTCTLSDLLYYNETRRTTDMARVYADVNARLGPGWYDYGMWRTPSSG